MPLVSVIMPTYNRAELIVQAVRSVIAQTVPDWELIVVDDGSTDDTVNKLQTLAEPRLKLVHEPHIGNSARLRNIGVAASRGDYLAFLDSDDLWLPSKLELQLQALLGKDGAWSYTDHELIDASGERMPRRAGRFSPISGYIARDLILDRTGASIITWLVPRNLFERTGGFDESLTMREDLDLVLRLAELGEAIPVAQALALAREHPSRKTMAGADQHLRSALVFQKAAQRLADPELKKLARRRAARHHAATGEQFVASGELTKGLATIGRSLLGGAAFRQCVQATATGCWRLLRHHLRSR